MNKLNSRKLITALLLTAWFSYLLIGKVLNAEVFGNMMSLIWIGYFAANVGDKWTQKT